MTQNKNPKKSYLKKAGDMARRNRELYPFEENWSGTPILQAMEREGYPMEEIEKAAMTGIFPTKKPSSQS